jgi:hypothetical protein
MRVDDSVLIHRITHSMDANIFRLEKVGRKVKLKTQQRMVGTTIQSNSFAGTHSERVEREVKQLLEDMRRIEPAEDPFCLLGDLFVDEPRVERYFEALIGEFNFGSDGWNIIMNMRDRPLYCTTVPC